MERRRFLRSLASVAGAAAVGGSLGPYLIGCRSKSGTRGAPAGGGPAGGGAASGGAASGGAARRAAATAADLVVCAGHDPYAQTQKAIETLGGIDLFVKKGDRVVLTPNLAFARTPEQGANTHPRVVRAVIDACVKAGAEKIYVVDYVLDAAAVAFKMNGVEDAVKGTIARLSSPEDERQYQKVDVSKLPAHVKFGVDQAVAREVMRANAVISLPVIKDHEAAILSGALKKVMGIIWERRGYHRADLHACIAEINTLVRPTLVVADATRVLQTRGPKGPGEILKPNHVLASVDPVITDAYACRYLKKNGTLKHTDVPYIVQAAALLGTKNLATPKLLEVTA
jgi:uncharacterized protein (DUF362 family)